MDNYVRSTRNFLHGLTEADSWDQVVDQAPSVVRSCVERIRELLRGQDLFDVLDLFRQHELTIAMMPKSDRPDQDSMVALVEIVAMVGASSGVRFQPGFENLTNLGQPNALIGPLRDQVLILSRLAQMIAYAELSEAGALGPLASRLRASELMIRNKHYTSISNKIMTSVLETPVVREILLSEFGYGYSEVARTSAEIMERYAAQRFGSLEVLGRAERSHSTGEQLSESQIKLATEAMLNVFSTPGDASSFTVEEIADRLSLSRATVGHILHRFSIAIQNEDAVETAIAYVHGSNPFAGKGLLRDPNEAYLIVSEAIPADSIRASFEAQLKTSKVWTNYDLNRGTVSESLVIRLLTDTLGGVDSSLSRLRHYAPARNHVGDSRLSRNDLEHLDEYEIVEADALLLADNLAFCVEVKAGSITTRAREGRIRTLERDIRRTIGDANFQASRLRNLIVENGGLWLKGKNWLELSHIREVYCLAVCLDDLGPLAIGVDDLIRAGILKQSAVPWIVSIHDLMVLNLLMNHPAEFPLYLSRRTDPMTARRFQAVDELDLLMLFFKGHYFRHPDPDEIFSKFPDTLPPTLADRRRYKQQSVRTHVQTHTDPLDAWMDWRDGLGPESDRPIDSLYTGEVVRMIMALEGTKISGWLRASMDLLDLDGDAHTSLAREVETLVHQSTSDGQFHSAISVSYTSRGSWALILATTPKGDDPAPHFTHLTDYMRAKRYQLQLDRIVGFLIDHEQNYSHCNILDSELHHDEDTEKLISRMGLLDAREMRQLSRPGNRSSKSVTRRRRKK